jgi:protein subunit release factor B
MSISKISFGNERPIYCVKVQQEDGSTKEVMMTESEIKVYRAEQERIKEEKKKEEALKKQQEWQALISGPQIHQKEK